MGNDEAGGMTTISGGGIIRDKDAPNVRCISCGAFGVVNLCPKHWEELMKSFDYYARGAFKRMIDTHMEMVKVEDSKVDLARKKSELQQQIEEVARLQRELGESNDGEKQPEQTQRP